MDDLPLIDRCTNIFGPLKHDVRARLERFFAEPTAETWDEVKSVIIRDRGMVTVWQAVGAYDPTFPRTGPSWRTGEPMPAWPYRIPEPVTVMLAIEQKLKEV